MRKRLFCSCVIATLSVSLVCFGSQKKVDEFFSNATEQQDAPGSYSRLWKTFLNSVRALHRQGILDGEILITKHNKVVLHLQGHQIRAKGDREPLFMIGSESKQFTAVALLKALYETSEATTEAEKIADVTQRLQWPISSYLGSDAPIWGHSMPSWANTITLHQLLSMTSGIQNFTDVSAYSGPDPHHKGKSFDECPHSGREILDLVKNLPLLFAPGSAYSYSNTNYCLLSFIIQAITKSQYIPYMNKTIFRPLSLHHTSVVRTGRWPDVRRQSKYRDLVREWNYNLVERSKKLYPPSVYENLKNAIGAGSMVSSAKDLIRWNRALYEKNFLPPGLFQLFTTPNLNDYGYGIKISDHPYGKVFQHEGAIDTFQIELIYFQRQHISIAYLSPITSDNNKLVGVYNRWLGLLTQVIPDPSQRKQRTSATVLAEYPEIRNGMGKTKDMLALFFGITPVS